MQNLHNAPVVQRIEHITSNDGVTGSNPVGSTYVGIMHHYAPKQVLMTDFYITSGLALTDKSCKSGSTLILSRIYKQIIKHKLHGRIRILFSMRGIDVRNNLHSCTYPSRYAHG